MYLDLSVNLFHDIFYSFLMVEKLSISSLMMLEMNATQSPILY